MHAWGDTSGPSIFAGRQAECAQVRAVAETRGGAPATLLVTGEPGIGRTAVVRNALRDFPGQVQWSTAGLLDASHPYATAKNHIAAFDRINAPVQDDLLTTVRGLRRGTPSRELASRVGDVLARAPRSAAPTVVVFEDVHRWDPSSAEALAHLARQNHRFDHAYVITCRDGQVPAGFEGLPRLRLGPLAPADVRACLRHWTRVSVSDAVAAELHELGDGNPGVLQTMARVLTSAQLVGDVALPQPGPVDDLDGVLAELARDLDPAALRGLACFGVERGLPGEVVVGVVGSEVLAGLVNAGLVAFAAGQVRVVRAVTGWAALARLPFVVRVELHRALARAWEPLDDVRTAYYRTLAGDLDRSTVALVQAGVGAGPDLAPALLERMAEAVATSAGGVRRAADQLLLVAAAERAGHLQTAVEALHAAERAPVRRPEDVLGLVRWRGLLSHLTREPAVAVPTARDLADVAALGPEQAFVGWTELAWSALDGGAADQARRCLHQAQRLGHAAPLPDRASWRWADAEWHRAVGHDVRPETLREAVARWCETVGRAGYREAARAVRTLTALEDVRGARHYLVEAEAGQAAGGCGGALLLGARLGLDLAEGRLDDATATAEALRSRSPGSMLQVPELAAHLVRLAALTGDDPAGTDASGTPGEPAAYAAAETLRHLLAGAYGSAVMAGETALRHGEALYPWARWDLLADLLEAHVAAGDATGARRLLDGVAMPTPATARTRALRLRCAALVAPPVDVKTAFAEAIEACGYAMAPVERGRTQLAYARRMAGLGLDRDAERLRTEAAGLFAHHGLRGWQQHALRLPVLTQEAVTLGGLSQDRLDTHEVQVVRMLLDGRRNQAIADALFVSLRSLEKSLTGIYHKLDVATKHELLSRWRNEQDRVPASPVGD